MNYIFNFYLMSPLPTFHSTPSSSYLVTVIKSPPKKTAFTPSILVDSKDAKKLHKTTVPNLNKSFARGLPLAAAMEGTSNVPPPSNTVRPGKNWKQAHLASSISWGVPQKRHTEYLQWRRIWSFLRLDEQTALWRLMRHLMWKIMWSF